MQRNSHKKTIKKTLGGVVSEALGSQFELDFTLIACMESTVMGIFWYLECDVSFHMKVNKYFFSELEEKYLQLHIHVGYDGRYNTTDISTVNFQRGSSFPLKLKDVMFVLGLKKNLVSVMVLEDRGYNVIFRKGKAFLHHIATRQVKNIRIQIKNLYKLDV